jgi:fatty-acyl-CoA synthase
VANSRGIINEGLQLIPERGDKGVSWLPLYHDMGLIGFVIAPICHRCPRRVHPDDALHQAPERVDGDRPQATAARSPSPRTSRTASAAQGASASDLEQWDLSCLRVLGCGAEPIHPETMRKFVEPCSPMAASCPRDDAVRTAWPRPRSPCRSSPPPSRCHRS